MDILVTSGPARVIVTLEASCKQGPRRGLALGKYHLLVGSLQGTSVPSASWVCRFKQALRCLFPKELKAFFGKEMILFWEGLAPSGNLGMAWVVELGLILLTLLSLKLEVGAWRYHS